MAARKTTVKKPAAKPEAEETTHGIAWAMDQLVAGVRVTRAAWVDNKHFEPGHIRSGIRLSHDDIYATDWEAV